MWHMRLFIGATPPAETLRQLDEWVQPIRSMNLPLRWTSSETVHLTLHFLGEVNPSVLKKLMVALDRALGHQVVIPVQLEGLGVFSRFGSLTHIWAAVRKDTALQQLHERLLPLLQDIGIFSDKGPFFPHITLARARSASGIPVVEIDKQLQKKARLSYQLDRLTLFSSTLSPAGARHHTVKEYPLVH